MNNLLYSKSLYILLNKNDIDLVYLLIDKIKNSFSIYNDILLEIDYSLINNIDITTNVNIVDIIIKIYDMYLLNIYDVSKKIISPYIISNKKISDEDYCILKEFSYVIFKYILLNNKDVITINDILDIIDNNIILNEVLDICPNIYKNLILKLKLYPSELFLFLIKKYNINRIK